MPTSFSDGLRWWRELAAESAGGGLLIHGGDDMFDYRGMRAVSWRAL